MQFLVQDFALGWSTWLNQQNIIFYLGLSTCLLCGGARCGSPERIHPPQTGPRSPPSRGAEAPDRAAPKRQHKLAQPPLYISFLDKTLELYIRFCSEIHYAGPGSSRGAVEPPELLVNSYQSTILLHHT